MQLPKPYMILIKSFTEGHMAEQKMPEKMEKVEIPLLEVKPSNNNNKAEEVSENEGQGVISCERASPSIFFGKMCLWSV